VTLLRLVRRTAGYHWRTNLAVVIGVAVAVSVLGGALLVGDSVRGSLRDIALSRLGKADVAVTSTGFFREDIVHGGMAPLIVASGFVTHEPSGKRAGNVTVYGVDERFWTFHGVQEPPGPAISQALATELGVAPNDVLLVRLQRPSEIPVESLFGRKEEVGRTIRVSVAEALPRERLGEFSLRPQQGELRAVFLPLGRVQRDLGVTGKVNTQIYIVPAGSGIFWQFSLEDLGLNVRVAKSGGMVIVDSPSGILSEPMEAAVRAAAHKLGATPLPVFTYLANSLTVGDRSVPYSLMSATDAVPSQKDGIVLNDWTAKELAAKPAMGTMPVTGSFVL
jgi:putative ABC transport system permease protein